MKTLSFVGTGVADGDKAKWVASSASADGDCSGAAVGGSAEATVGSGAATFTFTQAGLSLLSVEAC